MKLGFAIKVVSEGAGEPLVFNKGQWSKKVVDKRDYLKLFSGLQGTDNTITFMTFEENGCFLTIMRSIPGRDGDSISAWIYIPNTIEVSGENIDAAYRYAAGILNESNLSSRQDEINNFFSTSYPDLDYAMPYVASQGEEFGVRFIDKEPISMLLGEKRYQTYYSKFKTIFLLNSISDVKPLANNGFGNLTGQPLKEYIVLRCPNERELSVLGANEGLCFDNKVQTPFANNMIIERGSVIKLIAKRKGYNPVRLIPFSINISGETVPCAMRLPWQKHISNKDFSIKNGSGEPVSNANIMLLGRSLNPIKGLPAFDEESCRRLAYEITAPGYEPANGEADFSKGTHIEEVIMHRKVKSAKNQIILDNGRRADITIEAKGLNVSHYDCPLTGYTYDEDEQAYVLSSWFKWKQRLIGVAITFIVSMSIVGYTAFDQWLDTFTIECGGSFPWVHMKEIAKTKTSEPLDEQPQNENSETKEEIVNDENPVFDYLKNHTWKKADLESYKETKGLYDELNEFEFDKVLARKETLAESEQMIKLVDAIESSRIMGIDPKVGKELNDSKYNPSNDTAISIERYINWIKEKHQAATAPAPQKGKTKSVKDGTKETKDVTPSQSKTTIGSKTKTDVEKKPSKKKNIKVS